MMQLSGDISHHLGARLYVDGIIAQHRARTCDQTHHYHGHNFVVSPTVYSPFIAPSGNLGLSFAGEYLFSGKTVLDIGCGSGIIASLIAASGASLVVGTDINGDGIANSRNNARKLGVADKSRFYKGHLFDPIANDHKPFDIVFANLPFTDGEPTDILEAAFYDKSLASIRQFLKDLPNWLAPEGKGYLCLSEFDYEDLQDLAATYGIGWEIFLWRKHELSKLFIVELTL